MTDQHPITPPRELVRQWIAEIWHEGTPVQVAQSDLHLAARAAQWGADQELEACCDWASKYLPYLGDFPMPEDKLRAARRPKPPSLKESALNALEHILRHSQTDHGANTIRRALEALPDD
jgi:hypothetical protein